MTNSKVFTRGTWVYSSSWISHQWAARDDRWKLGLCLSKKEKRESQRMERVSREGQSQQRRMVEGVGNECLTNHAKCQQSVAIVGGEGRRWPETGVGIHPLRWRGRKKAATDKSILGDVVYKGKRACLVESILLDEVGDEVIWRVQVAELKCEVWGLTVREMESRENKI